MVEDNFKQTEIGLIPEDWYLNKVKDFTYTTAGGTPSTVENSYWNGNIPWMNSGELNKIKVYNTDNFITTDGLNNSSTKLIPENCVLIGLAGQGKTRGTVAINKIELCTNQSIGAFYPSNSVVQDYLFYNLQRRYHELRSLSTGDGGRGGLNLFILNNLLIPIPPRKEEQQAIASALSDADAWIESLEKLIAKKRLIKQGAMQELLTPKKDWEVKKLGEYIRFQTGYPFSSDFFNKEQQGFRLVKNRDLRSDDSIVHYNGDYLKSFIVENGDLLIGMDGDFEPLLWNKGIALLNQRVGRVQKIKNISIPFLGYILIKKLKEIESMTGSTTVKHLSHSDIENLECQLPEVNLQSNIANILSDMDAEIDVLEKKLQKAEQVKQGMMQQLLTGKIRLIKNTVAQPKEVLTTS